ncbi:MAG: hypothetical protein IJW59_01675 [Clostridia bacterium]|nr:hypothetical protein [Clostridia bacterium]
MGNKEFLYNSLYKKVLGEVSDIENISEKAINEYHKPFTKVIIDKSNPNKLGTVKKRFVRTKGSVLFDLFDEKRNNPNSNFVSCADPIIDDLSFSKEDFGNMYFSSIIKELRYGSYKFANADVIASRIANILGVKSAYNTLDPTGKYFISVDFLKDKQEIVDFGEFSKGPSLSHRIQLRVLCQC